MIRVLPPIIGVVLIRRCRPGASRWADPRELHRRLDVGDGIELLDVAWPQEKFLRLGDIVEVRIDRWARSGP